MSLGRDLIHFVKAFLQFIVDPRGYSDGKLREQQRLQAEKRRRLEERYGDLDTLFPGGSDPIHFSAFAGAIDYVSESLEEDDPARLAALIPDVARRLEQDAVYQPGYAVSFLHVFNQLQLIHRDQDLRAGLSHVEFPGDVDVLALGGLHPVLGGINLRFQREPTG